MQSNQRAAEEAGGEEGQQVCNHPAPELLISDFMANLQQLCSGTGPTKHIFSMVQNPVPYPPCVVPLSELRPLKISDMRLETHHRGHRTMLCVLTPPMRISSLMAIVEDEQGTAVLIQLYDQPEESVVPAKEALRLGVCRIKEPFFRCMGGDLYSVRVDHVSDVVWLEDSDSRIPQKWSRPALSVVTNSVNIRKQGNDAMKCEKWAAAERL